MSDTATVVDFACYKKSSEDIVARLTGRVFNILITTSENKQLKFCNRQLSGKVLVRDGQMSIALTPGGTIAWDLNVEEVDLEFGFNGDILLTRVFKTGRKKTMYITTGPI